MATWKIAEAIKSIPEKKEKLRKALETLQSYSSSLATFTLEWKDLEEHFSAIEKSIEERFRDLRATEPAAETLAAARGIEPTPRPELKFLCVEMDAMGLRSFISENHQDLTAVRDELVPAIRCAPDPALLVLDAMEGFYPPPKSNNKVGDTQISRRTCIHLLEKVHVIAPEIKPSVRDKAKRLAIEWKGKIPDKGDNALEAMGFLQLIASYGLVSEFSLDDVLELFISISRRKQATDLINSLGITNKLSDLIQKLNSKGRQLDAVKFVYAFNIVDKFPPVPLLKAYITESKKIAQEVQKKGNNSTRSQNEATAKEMGALKSVLKAIEEYKLETEYPHEILEKRIAQLEQKKADKKRTATAASASNSKTQQQQRNKRPRSSPSISAAPIAPNPYPPLIQTQPWLSFSERAPYMGIAGPYGLAATGSLYNHAGPSFPSTANGHGGTGSPPRSYLYSSESLAGTSGLYERPATYSGYPPCGLPPYGSSMYP